MKLSAYTNKGFVRQHNEDALYFAGNIISSCSMIEPLEIDIENVNNSCFVVIDGMGGYKGGETAAKIIAMTFAENIESWNITAEEARKKIHDTLKLAVQKITSITKYRPELSLMGAVLAGVVFCTDSILIFNCGDCRTYRTQGEYLEKLSHDHSVVQELYDNGNINEEDMRTRKSKNRVTAYISSSLEDLKIFYREVPYIRKEKFFICSDGVWETLPIEVIEKCFSDNSCKEIAMKLIQSFMKFHKNCNDNVYFLIIE